MVFRTITDDVTGANKSIGLFGLSLQNVIILYTQNSLTKMYGYFMSINKICIYVLFITRPIPQLANVQYQNIVV